jgi:hypothetical protein
MVYGIPAQREFAMTETIKLQVRAVMSNSACAYRSNVQDVSTDYTD